MKTRIALLLGLLAAGTAHGQWQPLLSSGVMVVAPSFLISDDLEHVDSTAAASAGWGSSGTTSWGYTTAPAPLLTFARSFRIAASSAKAYRSLGGTYNDVEAYVVFNQAALANAGMRIRFYNGGDAATEVAWCQVMATTGIVRANAGGGGNGDSVSPDVVTAGTTYHLWARYVTNGSSASLTLYMSTDGIKGTHIAQRLGGTSTLGVDTITLNVAGSTSVIYNKFRARAGAIGDNGQ
jgi:hypothetical protein